MNNLDDSFEMFFSNTAPQKCHVCGTDKNIHKDDSRTPLIGDEPFYICEICEGERKARFEREQMTRDEEHRSAMFFSRED